MAKAKFERTKERSITCIGKADHIATETLNGGFK